MANLVIVGYLVSGFFFVVESSLRSDLSLSLPEGMILRAKVWAAVFATPRASLFAKEGGGGTRESDQCRRQPVQSNVDRDENLLDGLLSDSEPDES